MFGAHKDTSLETGKCDCDWSGPCNLCEFERAKSYADRHGYTLVKNQENPSYFFETIKKGLEEVKEYYEQEKPKITHEEAMERLREIGSPPTTVLAGNPANPL